MRKLVKMLNKQDVRHLLVEDIWSEDYFDSELYVMSDKIMKEDDNLRGDGKYEEFIRDQGYDIDQRNKILFLTGVLHLFYIDKKIAESILKETESKYSTKKEVEKALNNKIFDIRVEAEKEKAKKLNRKETTFEEMCIPLEEHFKIDININITVAKFRAWENRLKESIKKHKA